MNRKGILVMRDGEETERGSGPCRISRVEDQMETESMEVLEEDLHIMEAELLDMCNLATSLLQRVQEARRTQQAVERFVTDLSPPEEH